MCAVAWFAFLPNGLMAQPVGGNPVPVLIQYALRGTVPHARQVMLLLMRALTCPRSPTLVPPSQIGAALSLTFFARDVGHRSAGHVRG